MESGDLCRLTCSLRPGQCALCGLSGRRAGEPFSQFDRNPVFGSASTDSYWLLDLAAGFQFRGFGERDIRVNVELRNALDEVYRDFLNTYKAIALNPGRDLRLTLEVPLG